jgi:hypothetical protein
MALEDGVAVRTADADEVTRQVVLEALALALRPYGYHPTGTYDLDRPAWELCHIKALRQRDPEPSWYDAQAHDAWLERE